MDKVDKIDEELSRNLSDVFTPETLAWHLLVSDNLKNVDVGQLMASIDLDEEPNPKVYNREAYEFEILLTIYMEMVFGWFKLLHLMDNEQKGIETEFKPDLSKLSLDDLENPFKENFEIIGYNLHINQITDMDYYENLRIKSYCRTALRDLQSDYGFFNLNKNNIDPEKRYHFVMNGGFKGEKFLRNIYMLIKINNVGYKVNFTHCL